MNVKEAVFSVLREAYNFCIGEEKLPVSARSLFYVVRQLLKSVKVDWPRICKSCQEGGDPNDCLKKTRTCGEFVYNPDFSQQILPEYQRTIDPLPLVYYEPSGVFHEPHGGQIIHLGDLEERKYKFPELKYNKILYIEKKGPWPTIEASQIHNQWDMAIFVATGVPSTAIRRLFERAETEEDYTLYILHDADPGGYNMVRNLREATERMPEYSVNTIDLGLTISDAIEMKLAPEPFKPKKAIMKDLTPLLSGLEREYFIHNPRRFEINFMTPSQLITYIDKKLDQVDAPGKIIPDDYDLIYQYKSDLKDWISAKVDVVIREKISTDKINEAVMEFVMARDYLGNPSILEDLILEGFYDDSTQSWSDVIDDVARERRREGFDAAIEKIVVGKLKEALEKQENDGEE
jgi:hypothetical protein